MKQHLVKLLLEEFKQDCLFHELAEKGIDLRNAGMNIYNIIFDIIGFPEDGTEIPPQSLIANPGYNQDCLNAGQFSRDYLYDKYTETFNVRTNKYKVIADEHYGLKFEILEGLAVAEKKTAMFVDWLYKEIERVP